MGVIPLTYAAFLLDKTIVAYDLTSNILKSKLLANLQIT